MFNGAKGGWGVREGGGGVGGGTLEEEDNARG